MAKGTVKQSFELAPQYRTMDELGSKLANEGCTNVNAHLQDSLL